MRPARSTAASLCPPRRMGTRPFSGGGSEKTREKETYRPSYDAGWSAHSARMDSMHSSRRLPRWSKAAPTAAYSSRCQPMPRPNSTRPPERRSTVATRSASTAGAWQRRHHDGGPEPQRRGGAGEEGQEFERVGHRHRARLAGHPPAGGVGVARLVGLRHHDVFDGPHRLDSALLEHAGVLGEEGARRDQALDERGDDADSHVTGPRCTLCGSGIDGPIGPSAIRRWVVGYHPPAAPVPPSVLMVWPTTKSESSLARNRMTRA